MALGTAMAIATLASGLIGAGSSIANAQANRDLTALENQKNRDWQERMSTTAYQRTVQDLEKAGLNKSLAYGASPASAPSGASGVSSTPLSSLGFENSSLGVMKSLKDEKNLALDARRLDIEQNKLDIKREEFELAKSMTAYKNMKVGFGNV